MSSDIILGIYNPCAIPPGCPYCFRPLGFKDELGPLNPDEARYEMIARQMIDTKVTTKCHTCGETSRVVAGEGLWRYRMERTTPHEESGSIHVSTLLRLVRYDDGTWELARHSSTRWEVPMTFEEIKSLARELPRIVDSLENGPVDKGPRRTQD